MSLEEIVNSLQESLPDALLSSSMTDETPTLVLRPESLYETANLAKERWAFDMPDCIVGTDLGETLEVTYILYSVARNESLRLKCGVSPEDPILDSVTPIWPGADWQEREIYDLLGIEFSNHPDLRRILLPDDFEGYPLRKSFQETD